MNYQEILKEIEDKVGQVNRLAAEVYKGSPLDPGYGKGAIYGITSEEGVVFGYYEYGEENIYRIPLSWLEMPQPTLQIALAEYRREQEEAFAKKKAEGEAKQAGRNEEYERNLLAKLKAKYES